MTTIISSQARQRYEEAYRIHQEREYPSATSSFGYLICKFPDTRKANGLTLFVTNYLNWMGHRATRIASTGRVIKSPQRQASGINLMTPKYIPGPTRRGTADVSATVMGRSVMIEIKVGKDRPSEWQLKEQVKERAAGGVYEFIHDPDEFLNWYDGFVKQF